MTTKHSCESVESHLIYWKMTTGQFVPISPCWPQKYFWFYFSYPSHSHSTCLQKSLLTYITKQFCSVTLPSNLRSNVFIIQCPPPPILPLHILILISCITLHRTISSSFFFYVKIRKTCVYMNTIKETILTARKLKQTFKWQIKKY